MTEEEKPSKISVALKRKKCGTPSTETRDKMSAAQKGRSVVPLVPIQEKMSVALKGKKRGAPSEGTRGKMSAAQKEKKRALYQKKN